MDEKDLVQKYKEKLKQQMNLKSVKPSDSSNTNFSVEYQEFRKNLLPKKMGFYEKLCNFAEKIMKPKVNPEKAAKVQAAINSCHLEITPSGVNSLSILLPVIVMLFGLFIFAFIFGSLFFTVFILGFGLVLMLLLGKIPFYLADVWRMKSSNQMVLCIFYIVTYMRHTSNLERAVQFAGEHLSPPLSLDLKKVIWDVETEKFENVKESLDFYLQKWRETNMEFVESMHLIESSLYEGSEERRLSILDKALDVVLEQTYEKMLHFAQNLKGPITMLHMLGIILPILGLVMLPMMVSFMESMRWYYIAAVYNIAIPILVYFLGKNILSKRPTGYGETDVSEMNPELKKYRNILIKVGGKEIKINPAFIAVFIGCVLFFLALVPLMIHFFNPYYDADFFGLDFLGYRVSSNVPDEIIGPFGMGASLFSLLFPLSIALSLGLYFRLRSKNVIKIRTEAKKLENEFASALFQLGNRLGDGLPAEIAFQKVAEVIEDTAAGKFFKIVATNIIKLGQGVKEAIFNPKTGAITVYPSAIIHSSMKVLIESVKKGPLIAAQALLSIARYIKEIHKVNERLKDLMADIISDMKSQISFLTPAISGIVIGITSMITFILGRLSGQISNLGNEQVGTNIGALANLFGDGIPTYYFQAVVGIYIVQIVYVLTVLSNSIENGEDKLQERFLLGNNLIKSTLLYCFIAAVVMLVFNIIAMKIVGTALVLN